MTKVKTVITNQFIRSGMSVGADMNGSGHGKIKLNCI